CALATEAGELPDLPVLTPSPAELADLELLLNGAFRPLTGFLGAVDSATVAAAAPPADGPPRPAQVTLAVPEDRAKEERIPLTDPGGVRVAGVRGGGGGREGGDGGRGGRRSAAPATGGWRAAGEVEALGTPEHGPFRGMRRRPADVSAEFGGATALAVAT